MGSQLLGEEFKGTAVRSARPGSRRKPSTGQRQTVSVVQVGGTFTSFIRDLKRVRTESILIGIFTFLLLGNIKLSSFKKNTTEGLKDRATHSLDLGLHLYFGALL